MNSSGSTSRSAPSAAAAPARARTFAALPCDIADGRIELGQRDLEAVARSVMADRAPQLNSITASEAHALGEREQPERARHQQRHPDRGRADSLTRPIFGS